MELKNQTFELQLKSVDDVGFFSGYASVFGNRDTDNEVVDRGAFAESLKKNRGVVPIFFGHDRGRPIGWGASAAEDNLGLKVTGSLLLDSEDGRLALDFMKKGLQLGARPGLSIGFSVAPGGDYFANGIRHFKNIELREWSLVPFASNDQAFVTFAKGAKDAADVHGKLTEAIGHLSTAQDHAKMAAKFHEKGLGILRDLSVSGYLHNDINALNPVGGKSMRADTFEVDRVLREISDLADRI